VRVEYPRTVDPFGWRRRGADVALNARVAWRIVVRGGGVSGLEADLGGLRLESFEVAGDARRVDLALPVPSGTVSLRFDSGVSNVSVRHPKGVAARIYRFRRHLQVCDSLLPRHGRKVVQAILQRVPCCKGFDQDLHRHPSILEYQRACAGSV
jgi:hypothetical protein